MRRIVLFGLLGVALALAAMVLLPSNPPETARSAIVGADALPPRARPSEPVSAQPIARAPPARHTVGSLSVTDARFVIEEDDVASRAATLSTPASRIDALVQAGFDRLRAEEIVAREAELRRAAAARQYGTTGTVGALSTFTRIEGDSSLRAELGDAEFERYLAALGRPTHVAVAGAAAESAAAYAGLTPGDEIHSYDGRRVFNLRELNELAQRRSLGESVPVGVVRDGMALQLYVTGGPLGLTPAEPR